MQQAVKFGHDKQKDALLEILHYHLIVASVALQFVYYVILRNCFLPPVTSSFMGTFGGANLVWYERPKVKSLQKFCLIVARKVTKKFTQIWLKKASSQDKKKA